MFSWEEFKNDKIAVHCKTEEEAKEFCKMMNEQGLKWNGGGSYLSIINWKEKREKTCYSLGFYDEYYTYVEEKYKIYEFEEVKKEEREMKNFTKADLKDGMILEYNSGKRVLNMAGNFYTAPNYFDKLNRTFCGIKFDTDIEIYTDNLTHCFDEERTIKRVYTVKKDYRGNPISLFKNENLELLWEYRERRERKESFVKLDDFERELLNRLKNSGHELLVRDKNGGLFAFGKRITKSKTEWGGCNAIFIDKEFDTFHFVKWEDDTPWNIEELLKNN